MVIGLIGEKLAGKDVVAEYLVKKYGAEHFRTSHILNELLGTLGLEKTRRNAIDIGIAVEKMFGQEVVGKALAKSVLESSAKIVINNGLRQPYQFEQAKNSGAKIIYVTAPLEIRHKRSLESVKDEHQDLKEFAEQEKEWIEQAIPELGKKADFRIENTGSLEDLYNKVDEIIKQLN